MTADDDSWIFSGYPGHFINAADCVFHLTTYVNHGTWMISTIGDYRRSYGTQKILLGHTDESYFETHVFPTRPDTSLSLPAVLDWTEHESRWYSSHVDATNGHIDLCRKYQLITRE
jgi:hypothetical protein